MSLANVVAPGTRVRVTGVRAGGPLTYRLMEMGFVAGAEVQFVRRAPLGDPLHIRLGDCELSLRAADAAWIDVAEF
jgi:ferrous iron transport protein A